MSKELVEAFNALPRRPKAPSGLVPNEWHFDIRYIQMEPTPSHIIYFLQPESHFTHMERLPIGIASNQSGLKFFPETAKEAAPTVAKGILHAFVNNMGCNDKKLYPHTEAYAPWKLFTEEKSLAVAVGKELKRMGVRPDDLCTIGVSSRAVVQTARKDFSGFFYGLKMVCGLEDMVAAVIQAPDSIKFENYRVPQPEPMSAIEEELNRDLDDEGRLLNEIGKYCTIWSSGLPSDGTEYEAKSHGNKIFREIEIIKARLEEKPERVVNAAADRGDADAALDYGIRQGTFFQNICALSIGLGCKRNRKRSRDYLIKAAYSSKSSQTIKAMAHGILIQWYLESNDGGIHPRCAFAAAHHCNIAAQLCLDVSPSGARASPAVLWFMSKTFKNLSEDVPEMYYWYKDAIHALEVREKQYGENRKKMAKKRLKNTVRYRCAALGCDIEADTGAMLSRCSGPCDADKKPYYCSKECQRADWKNHKPFCRPGAECSVVDDGSKYNMSDTAPAHKSEAGALQIPITFKDGKTILFSSSTMDMSKELVEAFNALPRKARMPSGRVPNEWHFDIRYIQMEPTPSHVIYFLQPQSLFTHMERLPIGIASNQSGLEFFPETAKEAAPMLAKGILHAFINNMGLNDRRLYPPTDAYAPWKLFTEDRSLAVAVGQELKRIGVRPDDLCHIGVSSRAIGQSAQENFSRFFDGLKKACGLEGIVAAVVQAPECIMFQNYSVPQPKPVSAYQEGLNQDYDDDDDKLMNTILEYYNVWSRGVPSDGTEYEVKSHGDKMQRQIETIKARLEEKSEHVVNAAADRGDGDAALDYGVRLTVGLGCKLNRKRARDYLIKAACSSNSSQTVKAMAHGILIQWYLDSTDDRQTIRARYLFAAAHHCNMAAKLCVGLSPSDASASSGVLWFMSKTFKTMSGHVPELNYWYKDAIRAMEAREREYEQGRSRMVKKRLKNTIRYRCAAPDCDIEADKGSMLSCCSGPCDADKKPHYCSKECQRADWKNHKPFCRPGAECSVIDNGSKYDISATAPTHKSEAGALRIPITTKDGETVMFSSSTMDAQMLKDLKEASKKHLKGL
ncbi:hypothetical protein CVT25_008642 [Psilocybe cyanescens]|uniref:MYND-type domain-containing protein n=1 Tax=Psilocybe cyanescens TaxID=93625 RepID=A0A409XNW2_PSICY|nr:hypothetical protein CVT25_008642 [Psilocybe cyanescens]